MFRILLARLLASLLLVACVSQSGMAAVRWELAWDTAMESAATEEPVSSEKEDGPVIEVCPLSGSMQMQTSPSASGFPSGLADNELFQLPTHSDALCMSEIEGEIIHIPWRNFKVPI